MTPRGRETKDSAPYKTLYKTQQPLPLSNMIQETAITALTSACQYPELQTIERRNSLMLKRSARIATREANSDQSEKDRCRSPPQRDIAYPAYGVVVILG
jgi:hypothetical protein